MEDRQDGRLKLGRGGEDASARYLKVRGYRLLARGFRWLRGEIDIVARDGDTLVFFEVKTRRGSLFGLPEEAVTAAKQKQIRRIAEGFLSRNGYGSETPCRFDVLSVFADETGRTEIRHIKNAF